MVETMYRESQFISEAAARECALSGAVEIDEDHLLLALLAVGGRGGERLVRSGVDLATARRYAAERVDNLIGNLEIRVQSQPLSYPKGLKLSARAEWSRRAILIMQSVRGADTDDSLLTALLDSPSGTANEILTACGGEKIDVNDHFEYSRWSGVGLNQVGWEQACAVHPDAVRRLNGSGVSTIFEELHGAEITKCSDGSIRISRTAGKRQRVSRVQFVDGSVLKIRVSVDPLQLTTLGKLLHAPVRASLRNSLRRQAIALVQSC